MAQIAAALVALAGCGPRTTDRTTGMIQVDIETSPTSTDPRFGTDATSSRINELVFDSLVKTDRNGRFVGRLAESIERPSDTEIIFHLKHGVRFSDGRELTARDVLYTYNSILAPESMSPKRAGLEQLKSIEAPDDYTVVMTTAHPYAPALELATEGIVPAGTPLPVRQTAPARSAAVRFRWSRTRAMKPFGSSATRTIRIRRAAAQSILLKIVPDPTVQALELAEGVCDFSGN